MDITDKEIEGLLSEMNAGKSIKMGHDERIWNDAHDRCISLLNGYRDGKGLFQDQPRMKT